MEYTKTALALEILAYHNKSFLDSSLRDNNQFSEEIQYLLKQAIKED